MGDDANPGPTRETEAEPIVEDRPISVTWVRAAALATAVALSLWFLIVQLSSGHAETFLANNELGRTGRRIAASGTLAILLAVPWGLFRFRSQPERLLQVVRALSPLTLLVFVPALFSQEPWEDAPIAFLIFAGAFAIGAERLIVIATDDIRTLVPLRLALPTAWTPLVCRVVLVGGVLTYALVISYLTILNHERLATQSSDLAEFDNLFFNALNGHPFRAPAIEAELADFSALKVHAEFILYLFLPFYALRPGPEALLVIQSVTVALTAVPIYALAARRLGEPAACVVACAFLLMPAVQQPNFYDFHFTASGMLFVASTLALADAHLAARERGEAKLSSRLLIGTCVAFSFALLSREDVSFGLGLLGLAIAASGAFRLGAGMLLSATLWFVVVKFWLMPRFGTMWFSDIYEDLKAQGYSGFDAIVKTLLTNPVFALRKLFSESRLLYVLHLLVPLAFLWVRRPWLALAVLPGLPFTLLATNREPLVEISFQYVYHFIPYVFAASVLGLVYLKQRGTERFHAALVALAIVSVAAGHQFGAIGNTSIVGGFSRKEFSISSEERERVRDLRELAEAIPEDASVAATEHEGPHVSTRLDFFSLKFSPGHDPEFLLVGPLMSGEAVHVVQLLETGEYGLVERRGDFFLLRRGGDPKTAAPLLKRAQREAERG
jgi:uncharacterized membrane protein